MADNYLEKQYDDYLARKAEWERRKRGAGTKSRLSAREGRKNSRCPRSCIRSKVPWSTSSCPGGLPTRSITSRIRCAYWRRRRCRRISPRGMTGQTSCGKGKMFGVLVVRTAGGGLPGYLAAFSGLLAGKSVHPFFVPPVYDLQRPGGFFKPEEEIISALNRRIAGLEADEAYRAARLRLSEAEEALRQWQRIARRQVAEAKARRDACRQAAALTRAEEEALTRESQYEHAEYKREEHGRMERIARLRTAVAAYEEPIEALRAERRQRSAALQRRLFDQFRLLNARGEERSLCDIFEEYTHHLPPGGRASVPRPNCCSALTGTAGNRWPWQSSGGERRPGTKFACTATITPLVKQVRPHPALHAARAERSFLNTL